MNWLRTFWTRFRSLWQRPAVKREASFGETMLQDIRFGLRMIAKNSGFSAVIILTLGLGIGVNTAVFSIFNAVFFRPLPYPAPEQLVQVRKQ